ncbi:DUF5825 family protein [Micromonosporaceae bacterium Da 78-11]
MSAETFTHVRRDEPVVFGADPEQDLRHLRTLREATSHAIRLHWTLSGRPIFPIAALTHLVPPSGGADEDSADLARRWSAAHRYASCYYRQGPGFVTVKDVRGGGDGTHMLIEDEDAAAFLALTTTDQADELDDHTRAMLPEAEEHGLLLRAGDTHLVLPYRLRNWPIPLVAA